MKKFLLHITILTLFSIISLPAMAVEYIVTYPDKSQLFRCEMHGAVWKVHITKKSRGAYRVIVIGKGVSGFSGLAHVNNYVEAARKGCGGEEK